MSIIFFISYLLLGIINTENICLMFPGWHSVDEIFCSAQGPAQCYQGTGLKLARWQMEHYSANLTYFDVHMKEVGLTMWYFALQISSLDSPPADFTVPASLFCLAQLSKITGSFEMEIHKYCRVSPKILLSVKKGDPTTQRIKMASHDTTLSIYCGPCPFPKAKCSCHPSKILFIPNLELDPRYKMLQL